MDNLNFNKVCITEKKEKDYIKRYDENQKILKQIDETQRLKGELLYRFLSFPVADGTAIYQIVKINKRTVRLEWCPESCDHYRDRVLDVGGTIDLDRAKSMIDYKDKINELFMKNKNKKEEVADVKSFKLYCYYYNPISLKIETDIVDVYENDRGTLYKTISTKKIPFLLYGNLLKTNINGVIEECHPAFPSL